MEKIMNNISLPEKKERNSNFELLRIIAMLIIVFHHFSVHGGFNYELTDISFNRLWLYFISMGGKIGVDIFVLISGYFLITNKAKLFDLKKVLKLWGQIFFYSVLIYLVFVIASDQPFEIKGLIKALFPISFERWWFASVYIILYILYPFINILLNSIDKKTYQVLLITLLIIWCILPTFTTKSFSGSNLAWFLTLYAVAGYVRLYGFNPKFTLKHYTIMFIVFALITFLSSVIFTILGTKFTIFGQHATYFFGQNRLPTFLSSLSLFMIFANMKMKNYKLINIISASTFGVYLIHDNNLVRSYLWESVFKNVSYQNSNLLWIYSIGVCLIVFSLCIIIDLVRKYTIEKLYSKVIDKCADSVTKVLKSVVNLGFGWLFGKKESEN